jgi:hypothetical protein
MRLIEEPVISTRCIGASEDWAKAGAQTPAASRPLAHAMRIAYDRVFSFIMIL